MYEMLPEIVNEGNYQVPITPFVTSILFFPTLVGRGKFSKFKVGPVTAKFEDAIIR